MVSPFLSLSLAYMLPQGKLLPYLHFFFNLIVYIEFIFIILINKQKICIKILIDNTKVLKLITFQIFVALYPCFVHSPFS